MRHFLILAAASAALMTGCSQPADVSQEPEPQVTGFDSVYSEISAESLREHTRVLSSDDFGGRLPATPGGQMTIDYLVKHFKQLGLQPGNGDSYLQAVELMQITADPAVSLQIGERTFSYKENMVVGSKREQAEVSVDNSELVFVGYGVNAPEYGWNDYEGIDVTGKTVVILVNDPGFENPDSGKFQGKTMTYFGRWTYKYEEASRQGAAAALIVHETAPASYGWSVVANSWSGPQYSLVSEDGGASRVAVEGWLSLEAAQQVFADAGLDYAAEKQMAMQGSYAKAMGINASTTINNTIERSKSYNVFATVPGSENPDEHIIYTAHWDHLGTDPTKQGDQIYNGAHDNATGTAASIVMAEAFAKLQPAPKRSVSFLLVTAEEQGLLGSQYYARNPIIALDKTIANINMDAMNILGRTKDVSVIGQGKSELEQFLTVAADKQGRFVTGEDRPEAGFYYRSDHFNFAKVGVPALYAKGGSEPIDESTADYRKRTSVITTGCYHQVCDQFREKWDFGGVEEDTRLLFDVGYQLVSSDVWPAWSETSEFQRTQ